MLKIRSRIDVSHAENTRLAHLLCRAAPKPRVPTHHRPLSYPDYLPMGCCSSTANGPEASQPANSGPGPVQVPMQMQMQAQVPMPTPPAPVLDRSSSNLSRPRTRTYSQQSIRHSTEKSGANSRDRAISAPHRVQATKSSSSQHSIHSQEPRKRANTSVAPARPSRSGPRPLNPGERDSQLGYEPLMTAL